MRSIYDSERNIRPPDPDIDLTKCPLYRPRPDVCCGYCHKFEVDNQRSDNDYAVKGPFTNSGYWQTIIIVFGGNNKFVDNPIAPSCKHPAVAKRT